MPFFLVTTYTIILVLGVSISGYLSYEGLLRTANEITLPLVTLLMMIIMTMDATISYFRTQERRYALPLFIWAIAAFFSIASNFNFLYSNFMRDDVTRATVTDQIDVFRNNMVKARAELSNLPDYILAQQIRADLNVELENLYDQINDPLRPGCGTECQVHMDQIERILGREITNMAVPPLGSQMSVVNAWYGRYQTSALDLLELSLSTSDAQKISGLMYRIDGLMNEYSSVDRVMVTKGGLDVLADLSSESHDIERETNALLPSDRQISLESIDPSLGRLGEIVYALQNGFVERPNLMATAISLVLASVVDILPLLLSFALFGKGRLEKTTAQGQKRSAGGRRIIGS